MFGKKRKKRNKKRNEASDTKLFIKAWLNKEEQKRIKVNAIADNMDGSLSNYMEMSCYEFLQQEEIKSIDLEEIYSIKK